MNKHKIILTVLLLASLFEVHGQNLHGNKGIEDSHRPNAPKGGIGTSLIDVDLYTGTGSVNIPIYDQAVDMIDVSVGLSYSLKGIRVDELASSVGLGWQLNAGGSITREVNGLEDEITLPLTFKIDSSSTNSGDSLQGYLVPGANHNISQSYCDDAETDVFHFDLCGRTLAVVFTYHNGNLIYRTYPKSEIQIDVITKDIAVNGADSNIRSGIYNMTGIYSNRDILTFNVTDESGNKFYFDRGDYQHKVYNFSSDRFYGDTAGIYYVTTKWNLKKLVTLTGREVTFDYVKTTYSYLENVTETLYPRDWEFDNGEIVYSPLKIEEQEWNGSKSHISKITYPDNTTVTFDLFYTFPSRCDAIYDFQLRNIIIENRVESDYKNKLIYKLNHSYFNTPNYGCSSGTKEIADCNSLSSLLAPIPANLDDDSAIGQHKKKGLRLKLNSVTRLGTDSSTTENYYAFGYNMSYALPYRFAPQKDYYGYYNGESVIPFKYGPIGGQYGSDTVYKYLSIPYHAQLSYQGYMIPIRSPYWGASRYHSLSHAQAFVLNKISNCSGGTDSIIYVNYDLENPDSSYGKITLNTAAYIPMSGWNQGSLTIDYDDIDTNLQGDTVNDGLVVGKIISEDKFNFEHTITTEYTYSGGQRFHRGGYTSYFDDYDAVVLTNYFLSPNDYVRGSNHGFSEVTVTTKGYQGQQLSKTVYKYSNLMGDSSSLRKPTGDHFRTMPADFKKYRMGLLQEVTRYADNSNALSSKKLTWEYVADSIEIMNGRVYRTYNSRTYWEYHVMDYELLRVKNTYTEQYENSKTAYDTVINDYDFNDNVKRITIKDSKGDTYKQYLYYNYDNSYSLSVLNTMNSNKVQFNLIKDYWKFNASDSSLVSTSILSPATSSGNYWFPAQFNFIGTQPLTAANAASTTYIHKANALQNSGAPGNNLLKTNEVTQYDDKQNPLEFHYNNEDIYESQIWDTKLNMKLAAATNASYDDIAFTSFESPSSYAAYGVADYDRGNWDFDPQHIYDAASEGKTPVTGKYIYRIEGTDGIIRSQPLKAKKYLLTYWMSTTESNPTLTVTSTVRNTVGNWKLYSAIVEPDSGDRIYFEGYTPTQGGTPVFYIDEIRLHPLDAAMSTYTYTPLFGLESVSDVSNNINHYEYDKLGRLSQVKDMRGNITRKVEASCSGSETPSPGNYPFNGGGRGGSDEAPSGPVTY